MKQIKILLFSVLSLIGVSAMAQTNVYTAPFASTGKQVIKCSGITYDSSGLVSYHAPGSQNTNKWFYPTTNVLTISFTNHDALIQYASDFGPNQCGRSSITWTDANFPHDTYQFGLYWSNNVVLPTNGAPVPLTTVGFRTNSP